MDITILSLLASISNKYVVGERLPKVPYRTLIDVYIDVSFLCQVKETRRDKEQKQKKQK